MQRPHDDTLETRADGVRGTRRLPGAALRLPQTLNGVGPTWLGMHARDVVGSRVVIGRTIHVETAGRPQTAVSVEDSAVSRTSDLGHTTLRGYKNAARPPACIVHVHVRVGQADAPQTDAFIDQPAALAPEPQPIEASTVAAGPVAQAEPEVRATAAPVRASLRAEQTEPVVSAAATDTTLQEAEPLLLGSSPSAMYARISAGDEPLAVPAAVADAGANDGFDAAAYYGRLRVETPDRQDGYGSRVRRQLLLAGAGLIVAAGAAFYALPSKYETTRNAQIDADVTAVAPQSAGSMTALHVRPNQAVEAGDLLAELDPGDLQQRLHEAKTRLARAGAAARDPLRDPAVQPPSAREERRVAAEAALAKAQARARDSAREQTRLTALLARLEATAQNAEDASARAQILHQTGALARTELDRSLDAGAAARAKASAAQTALAVEVARGQRLGALVAAARLRSEELRRDDREAAQAGEAARRARDAELAAAQAQYEELEHALRRTKIYAPVRGIVSAELATPGEQVGPGRPVLSIWNNDRLWVTASFDETQLPQLKRGQSVHLHVVALGLELTGRVESLAYGSEARLKHAPGGFATYDASVPQRAPVRIALRPGESGVERLRPGMTVETRVRVR